MCFLSRCTFHALSRRSRTKAELTDDAPKNVLAYTGGCDTAAAVTVVAGSGLQPEDGVKVIDNNLRTKWVAKGRGESLWLELAAPTIIDSVAIAFRKVGRYRSLMVA